MNFYERWLRFALKRPLWIAGFAAVLIVASYFCYQALGSDLLPAMDEGGFVIDYIMPPGSFAAGDQPHHQSCRTDAAGHP